MICEEGTSECTGGALVCNDTTGDNIDWCDGTDNDCDPSTPDGSGDYRYLEPCDGSDGDYCMEGVWYCPPTIPSSMVCSDNTGTTTEQCSDTDEDCDGAINEGFEPWGLWCDQGASATNLGSIRGDVGWDIVYRTGFSQEWFLLNIREENSSNVDLRAWIELHSPWGIDFNLHVYCEACRGPHAGSSYVSDLDGHIEQVRVGKDDTIWPNEDFNIVIGVIYGNRLPNFCDYWELQIDGNMTGVPITCE